MAKKENRLYPEDQNRVNQYLNEGYNRTERKPFKPMRMMIMLIIVVSAFSALSVGIAQWAGVY